MTLTKDELDTITKVFPLLGSDLELVIETGTHHGIGASKLSSAFPNAHIHTVEIDHDLANTAKLSLHECKNVTVHEGDSMFKIPTILEGKTDAVAIFYLDTCMLDEQSGTNGVAVPLYEELKIILDKYEGKATGCSALFVINNIDRFGVDKHWSGISVDGVMHIVKECGWSVMTTFLRQGKMYILV